MNPSAGGATDLSSDSMPRPPLMRRLGLIVALVLLLVFPACRSVSVGADNRYGRTDGAAVLNFPLGVKSKSTPAELPDTRLLTGRVLSVHDGDTITVLLA